MRLVMCGTAAGPFSGRRASSGYILQHDGHTLMLDCGPGSVREASRAGIYTRDIDAVVLSHLHLDHMLDVTTIAFQAWYHTYWPAPAVVGPPGTREAIAPLISFRAPNERELRFREVTEIDGPDERDTAGFVVRSAETPHAPTLKAYSRRFSIDGRSVVFSGDTKANPDLMGDLALHANLLLHECYSEAGLERYAAERPAELRGRVLNAFHNTHAEVQEVAMLAQDAGVRCLVLTHVLPTEDEDALERLARRYFRGEIVVAQDGLALEVE